MRKSSSEIAAEVRRTIAEESKHDKSLDRVVKACCRQKRKQLNNPIHSNFLQMSKYERKE